MGTQTMRIRLTAVFVASALWAVPALAQTAVPPPRPAPFPGAGTPPAAASTSAVPEDAQPVQANTSALGVVIYPAAVFLETIDAGMGQQYHIYGVNAPYADIVAYYRTTLKNGGRVLFQAPAMHQWDLGRFQEQSMVYPPSVVVKDYLWNGSEGYPHVSGSTITRYRTIIQVVPAPTGR